MADDEPSGEYVYGSDYREMRLRILLTGKANPDEEEWSAALGELLLHLKHHPMATPPPPDLDRIRAAKEKLKERVRAAGTTAAVGVGARGIVARVPFTRDVLDISSLDGVEVQWLVIGPAHALSETAPSAKALATKYLAMDLSDHDMPDIDPSRVP